MRTRVLWGTLLALAGAAGAIQAQSFLGTIRGTVVDPQGAAVSGASVLVVDESTGVPRAVETDAQGRFETPNLRPGTYRVEVITPSFKKYEQTGVVLRAAGTARADVRLELGALTESVTVSAEGANNITLESQAIARGLDEQQLRDLPRSSRDIQAFLLLNPNVLGGTDDMQFLGGRTYGVSYIQDGQASTNAIFGTVGNSAPGLDAIAEVQVLSNSYSAEYGGLAGVVVTTKRGANNFHGGAFYDFNGDGLNALTYNQKLSGVERGDPNTETHEHRWGASFGGPIKSGKTFFYANYEGSDSQQIFGGGRATVPTEAMRNGDFRGTAINPRDPLTGQPFPGQVIPAGRIDPAARDVMSFFWPLPNRGTIANGYGIFQQFVPKERTRNRADLRLDHEATANDSVFLRASYQHRDPQSFIFEGGTALTDLPILESALSTASVIGGWTKVFSPTVVNEFRVGYNYDNSRRESNFSATEVSSQLGVEAAPSLDPDRRGFPSFQFTGGANRPGNIADAGRNVDRTLRQNAFSISNNLTWIMGGHSLKAGGLYTRNMARDGFGFGVNFRGQYRFNGARTGNAFTDFLLGLPLDARDQVTTRGALEGYSQDVAVFLQDDWRVNPALTVFLGLRYEIVGVWHEDSDMIANFRPVDGGYHVVPNAQVAALLPPGLVALGRTRIAGDVGLSDSLVNTDKNNFSPRVGFAWRLGEDNKTVLRGGFGIFHPTVAVQGVRDLLATNEFRYVTSWRGGGLRNGFSGGTPFTNPAAFGNQGIDPDIQSPDIYQYNLTVERELPGDLGLRVSYIGSTMRKLLVDRDHNTLPANTNPWSFDDPEDQARLPFPQYGFYMDIVGNHGEGQLHAAQLELTRRWKGGLAVNAAYTLAHSDGNAPDTGNSSLGPVMFDPYDIEKDRGPDPNVVKHRFVANATWDVPVGHGRTYGADMPAWADTLFGGWTVSTLFQARSGLNLTPFFSGYYSNNPWNTGKPLDGLGNFFCCAWRPDQVKDPNTGGSRGQFFDVTAYALPAPGTLGNAKKGSLKGPGTWVANFAFYKDVVSRDNFSLQLSALLDNAFNHPQFFPGYGSGFVQLDSFLTDGVVDNGSAAVLGSGTIRNVEGFSPGRVFRIGLRARF
ncbi:MAG TPA: TonB-dependent receptor [Vicinamibacteria bacterium]|nr:TonB-dependent receptor [Vicinamibacteria bacterium]